MSNLSICHIHSVKNTSNVSVQNETYFLPDLLLSVYLSEQHLLPLSWRTSCSSLPPPHPWSNHSKALLILSLNICLLPPLPFGLTALRLLTSITFCKNKGLLTDLSYPFHPTFHTATVVTLTKSQIDSVPFLLQIVQRPPMILRTQATLLCTFSHPRKVLAFASYMPHKACHPPLFLSKSIFIGKRISAVPSPKHDWGCDPVRNKEQRQIILLFFGWYLRFNVFQCFFEIAVVNSRHFLQFNGQQPIFTYNL